MCINSASSLFLTSPLRTVHENPRVRCTSTQRKGRSYWLCARPTWRTECIPYPAAFTKLYLSIKIHKRNLKELKKKSSNQNNVNCTRAISEYNRAIEREYLHQSYLKMHQSDSSDYTRAISEYTNALQRSILRIHHSHLDQGNQFQIGRLIEFLQTFLDRTLASSSSFFNLGL